MKHNYNSRHHLSNSKIIIKWDICVENTVGPLMEIFILKLLLIVYFLHFGNFYSDIYSDFYI